MQSTYTPISSWNIIKNYHCCYDLHWISRDYQNIFQLYYEYDGFFHDWAIRGIFQHIFLKRQSFPCCKQLTCWSFMTVMQQSLTFLTAYELVVSVNMNNAEYLLISILGVAECQNWVSSLYRVFSKHHRPSFSTLQKYPLAHS